MKSLITRTHIDMLKRQKRIVGLFQFEHREDQNFSKWYSLTENLIIKAFGAKSNQLSQLEDIHGDLPSRSDGEYSMSRRLDIREAKEKFKDLLAVFIDELELDIDEEPKSTRRSSGVKMVNIQTVNQTVEISTVIKQVIENIHRSEPDPALAKEAETKLLELEKELNSKSPTWASVKSILEWLLNFSRDAFIAVLPVLLQTYGSK